MANRTEAFSKFVDAASKLPGGKQLSFEPLRIYMEEDGDNKVFETKVSFLLRPYIPTSPLSFFISFFDCGIRLMKPCWKALCHLVIPCQHMMCF
jgi:hypothetical protein